MGYIEQAQELIARATARAGDGVAELAAASTDVERAQGVKHPRGTLVVDPVTGQRGEVVNTEFAHVIAAPAEG